MTRSSQLWLVFSVASLSALAALTGCGDPEGRVQVTGSVKFEDGTIPKGATQGTIRFEPEDASIPNIRPGQGMIDPQTGEYSLWTIKPGDGAYPGKYKVTIRVDTTYPPKPNYAGIIVPLEYLAPDTTPLSAEINGQRRFDFTVPRRDPKKEQQKKKR
jgi:hypothetical protein